MEHRYALFVAHASIEAYQQLQVLLKKWKTDVTPDIIDDAARFGQQRAMDRIFPGLVRLPFKADPLPDIVMTLRYQYEAEPERVRPKNPDETTKRMRAAEATSHSNHADTAYRSQQAALHSDATQRVSSHSGVQRLQPVATISEHSGGYASAGASNPRERIRAAADAKPDDTQKRAGSMQPTKLKPIGAPPIFPWERKRNPDDAATS